MLRTADSFEAWLKQKWRSWTPAATLALLPALYTTTKRLIPLPSSGIHPHTIEVGLVWLQAAVIFFLKFSIARPLKDATNDARKKRPGKGVDQFVDAWRWLWLFWLTEYVVLAIRETVLPVSAIITPPFLNFFNNLTVVGLFVCYYVAGHKTVTKAGEAEPLPWQKALGVLVVLTAMNYIAALELPNADLFFNRMSGFAACLGTALLVGRLDSRYIGLPTWAMIVLYAYAAIQPMWAESLPPENDIFRSVVINCALSMKLLLFLVVQWALESGVLFYYADRIENVFDTMQMQRKVYLDKLQNEDILPD